MTGDWGRDELPLRGEWPTTSLPADRLPGVLAARAEGWTLAPDAPVWAFLPAVWPPEHRCWVEDRSVRYVRVTCTGAPPVSIPWSAWDHVEGERDVNELLVESGVPPRPAGRVWLLRPPPGWPDLDTVLRSVTGAADAAGVEGACSPPFVAVTVEVLRSRDPTSSGRSPRAEPSGTDAGGGLPALDR